MLCYPAVGINYVILDARKIPDEAVTMGIGIQFLENVISKFQANSVNFNDPKSRLQHYSLAERLGLPVYELLDTSGPGHSLSFTIEVKVEGKAVGKGEGSSKKVAARMTTSSKLLWRYPNRNSSRAMVLVSPARDMTRTLSVH